MIKLQHILHPIRSAKSLYNKVNSLLDNYIVKRKLKKISYGYRNYCWCGGSLFPLKSHECYGFCSDCGCYVNLSPPQPKEFKKVHSLNFYWQRYQKVQDVPKIEEV